MKVLTLSQPAATLIALGLTTMHTCSWSTPYRGPLAIHAAEVYSQWAKDRAKQEPLRTLLHQAGMHHWIDLPTGAIIGVCHLDDCRLITQLPEEMQGIWNTSTPGDYAWHFSHVQPLPAPVRARDRWGLWEWDMPSGLADMISADVLATHHQWDDTKQLRFASTLLPIFPID